MEGLGGPHPKKNGPFLLTHQVQEADQPDIFSPNNISDIMKRKGYKVKSIDRNNHLPKEKCFLSISTNSSRKCVEISTIIVRGCVQRVI